MSAYSIFCLKYITTTAATNQIAINTNCMDSCSMAEPVPVNPVSVNQTMALDTSPRHPPINRIQAVMVAKPLNISSPPISSNGQSIHQNRSLSRNIVLALRCAYVKYQSTSVHLLNNTPETAKGVLPPSLLLHT